MNIISLLPSATEILYLLGLGAQVQGITHECDFPPEARTKKVVTRCAFDSEHLTQAEIDEAVRSLSAEGKSLYRIDENLLKELEPDLIITQELCHVCAITPDEVDRAISLLPKRPKVVTLNPGTIHEVLASMLLIANECGVNGAAVVAKLHSRLEAVATLPFEVRPTVGCIEWFQPLWKTGHWVPEMVEFAGGTEIFAVPGKPSTRIEWNEIESKDPEILILMPCGCDLSRTRKEFMKVEDVYPWHNLKSIRNGNVFLVDANSYFSRSGPRLVEGVEILAEILHPEYFSGRAPIHSYTRIAIG